VSRFLQFVLLVRVILYRDYPVGDRALFQFLF
jgi:hypothetical protein